MSQNRDENEKWQNPSEDLLGKISFEEFINVLEKTDSLLEIISNNAIRKPIINIVGSKTHILCSEFMLATSQTLKSIIACCNLGNFSDANVLVRKYRDDLFQYLYIIRASNSIKGISKDELDKYFGEEITEEKLIEAVDYLYKILVSGKRKTKQDEGIDAWFENTLPNSNYNKCRRDYFNTSKYKNYLCGDGLVEECFESYLNKIWTNLDRTQNNFTHANGRKFLIANNSSVANIKSAEILLNEILKDIYMVTSCFLSVLILIEPNYIVSSDYTDYLECGLTPPEDSQYWVAPIVQEYVDKYVVKIHPELKGYLRKNNPYGMNII